MHLTHKVNLCVPCNVQNKQRFFPLKNIKCLDFIVEMQCVFFWEKGILVDYWDEFHAVMRYSQK
jgi:hypothetical protein